MRASYITYDPATGRLISAGTCPADMISKAVGGAAHILVPYIPDLRETYLDLASMSLQPRPQIAPIDRTEIRADGIDVAVLRDLPDPVLATIDGKEYKIAGGRLDFAADTPGIYVIFINHFPWKPYRVEVRAA